MATSTGSGGSSEDCEGDEQEDPSSSLIQEVAAIGAELQSLSVQESSENNEENELSAFRLQWQRELEHALSAKHESIETKEEDRIIQETLPLNDDERARKLFLLGIELERKGKLYEAIQHYKRALQILPDVEARLYESELRSKTPEVEIEPEEVTVPEPSPPSDDEDTVEGEDLVTRFQRLLAKKSGLCQMGFDSKEGHISWLPYEVLLVILRWVVSSELDAVSMERVAAVCRGFYLAAREPDIWRSICVKTWGIDCGTPRTHGYSTWRQMYIDRPRLQLNGCYISKTTYLRHGENCFQDHFYRPWYLVDYYRYLRFFPEGMVLMWTTAEEPASCVSQLKSRQPKPGLGIMAGHYRLVGDKVVILIKKTNSDKKPAQPSNTRFRSRRKENTEVHEQCFHLELELRALRSRRNWQLQWTVYAVSSRREQWTQLELSPAKFPPFYFSRVRNYTALCAAPLR